MRTLLFVLLGITSAANAQNIIAKAGVNYSADIVEHKLGKINYPGLQFDLEYKLSPKFSLNASYMYAKREYNTTIYLAPTFPDQIHYKCTDQSLILAARFYPGKFDKNLFFEAGLPLTYTGERRLDDQSLNGGNYNFTYYSYSLTTTFGMGIKYPLSKKTGLEFTINYSPSFNFFDLDYGTAGYLRTGLKLYFNAGR